MFRTKEVLAVLCANAILLVLYVGVIVSGFILIDVHTICNSYFDICSVALYSTIITWIYAVVYCFTVTHNALYFFENLTVHPLVMITCNARHWIHSYDLKYHHCNALVHLMSLPAAIMFVCRPCVAELDVCKQLLNYAILILILDILTCVSYFMIVCLRCYRRHNEKNLMRLII